MSNAKIPVESPAAGISPFSLKPSEVARIRPAVFEAAFRWGARRADAHAMADVLAGLVRAELGPEAMRITIGGRTITI